jgi:acetolactate synthase regulatory subunit
MEWARRMAIAQPLHFMQQTCPCTTFQVPVHVDACSVDVTRTCNSHHFNRTNTIVQTNKTWNVQRVETTTSNPFPLARHYYKAHKKPTHTPTHHVQVPVHVSVCSLDITRTYNSRCSIELTIVKINKSWDVQQVENTTSNQFLLALHCCKARRNHTHTPSSVTHLRRCTFHGQHSSGLEPERT